ncbi:MAG: thioesterase family protein, partial [Leptospirales bacterium]
MKARSNASEKFSREDFSFFETLRVRYAEIDAQSIVFNAHYLTYFDVAITEYFRARTGKSYDELVADHGMDFHVQQSVIDYRSPARFDDLLQIGVRGAWRGARVFWELAIFRGGELLCSGLLTYAAVDATNGAVKRISPAIAAAL